jgi:hypothetical protein
MWVYRGIWKSAVRWLRHTWKVGLRIRRRQLWFIRLRWQAGPGRLGNRRLRRRVSEWRDAEL